MQTNKCKQDRETKGEGKGGGFCVRHWVCEVGGWATGTGAGRQGMATWGK